MREQSSEIFIQPRGSKVRLTKTPYMLEVVIPPIASSPGELGWAVFCSAIISLITLPISVYMFRYLFIWLVNGYGLSSFSIYSWTSIIIAIYSIAAYCLFAMIGLSIFLFPLSMFVTSLRKVKLRITASEISLSYSSWSKFHHFKKPPAKILSN